jgi:hypothetical protein
MSRLTRMFAGLLIVSSLSGCCLLGHGGGYAPYGGGGGCGSCGPCGASAGGYPSAMYAPGMQQTAFAQPQVGGYPAVAAVPQDVLGTY